MFRSDHPINLIDDFLKKYLSRDRSGELKTLRLKGIEMRNRISRTRASVIVLRGMVKELEAAEAKILEIERYGEKLERYLADTKELVDRYKKIRPTRTKNFIGEVEVEDENTIERINIIEQYISKCREYYQLIDVRRVVEIKEVCPVCQKDPEVRECVLYCPDCSVEIEIISNTVTYKDVERISFQSGDRDAIENFHKTLKRIQGITKQQPPSSLYESLDRYFSSIKAKTGSEIRSQPLNVVSGTRGTVIIEELYRALQKTKNVQWYPDLNTVVYEYWGWPLPDFSHVENDVVDDYIQISGTISDACRRHGKSSLGTIYLAYQLLMNRGFPCFRHHFFKMPSSEPIADEYTKVWQEVCDIAGLTFFSIK